MRKKKNDFPKSTEKVTHWRLHFSFHINDREPHNEEEIQDVHRHLGMSYWNREKTSVTNDPSMASESEAVRTNFLPLQLLAVYVQ